MPTLAVEDDHLWYDEVGSGPPLVCLHGGWMDGDAWEPQVERFAGDFRVIRPDLRGHGRTGPTDPRRYSIGLFTDDLEELLAHLGVERPILCGLSLGNLVAQAYLDRHPESVAGAVLGGPLRSMPPVDVPGWLKHWASPAAGLRTSLSTVGSKATFRSLLGSVRAAQGRPWLSVDAATRERAVECAGRMSRQEFAKVFGAIYRFDPPDLGSVTAPTLAIYGTDESPLVKRQGRRIAAAVQDGAVASIADAAHLVNLDSPVAFNDAVGTFLTDVARGS